jgi:hypothetical protein
MQKTPEKSRFLFSFLCSNWRFIDRLRCKAYPDVCVSCDQENTSFHVLFFCPVFDDVRAKFMRVTGRTFCFASLSSSDREAMTAMCEVGRGIYERIAAECEDRVTSPHAGMPSLSHPSSTHTTVDNINILDESESVSSP